jgi:hypothetical protein
VSEYELAEAMNQLGGQIIETQAGVERTARINLEAMHLADRITQQLADLARHIDPRRDDPPSPNGKHTDRPGPQS